MISGVPGTPEQHSGVILAEVKRRGLPKAAGVIAIMTAMTESGIRVLANTGDPLSQQLPHDGIGWDYDSVGIFQQRPGWGSLEQRMDPRTSAGLFLDRLTAFDWASRQPWHAAQDVQVSAFDGTPRKANNFDSRYGGNYQDEYPAAVNLVDRLWGLGGSINLTTQEDDDMYTIYQVVGGSTAGRQYAVRPGSVPIWMSPTDKATLIRFGQVTNPDAPKPILQVELDRLAATTRKGDA